MVLKDAVLDHLTYTFEKEAWQLSLAMAVAGLSARQASWKPAPERHSIWQIVCHVILWKQGVLEAWEGKVPDMKVLEQADWQEISGDDAAWEADVKALHEVSSRVKERVGMADDAALAALLPTYQDVPDQAMAIRAMRMATHDSYHAGQIQYIRALQGA